jgi:uncharacterized RmlC-like cupin family protein
MEGAMTAIFRVAPGERTEGQATPGMVREQAIATERFWSGFVTTDPRMVSGWHHHDGYETSIYVLGGQLQMEFGADGSDSFVAVPGDFVYVGKHAIHRESNTSDGPLTAVVTRGGQGEVVVNVDGPG